MIRSEVKNKNSLQKFETEIRKWALENLEIFVGYTYRI